MPDRTLRVVVIGAGTAGPAAATFLARAGHSVVLLERAPTLGPVGAGLLLQPTGLTVLARLGLLRTVIGCGAKIGRLSGVNHRGRVLLDLAYHHLRPGLFGLGIHRGALFSALMSPLAEAGVELRTGVRVTAIENEGGGRVSVVDDTGAGHGTFDLAVVADGAKSTLRTASGFSPRVRTYPWGAMWFVAKEVPGFHDGLLRQVFCGTSRMVGFLPSGTQDSAGAGPRTTSVFWSVRADRFEAVRAAGVDALRRDVLTLVPEASPIIDQVERPEQLLFAEYRDAVMRRWHDPTGLPIVFIGDAAHAMSPLLGQGANLALQDAQTLADCVSTCPSVAEALARYSALRGPQLRYYQFVTRLLTPVFQSDIEPLAWGRDLFWGPACRVPFTRNQMLRGQAGVKNGYFRSLPLPTPQEIGEGL
ncbi:MAG: FAD-dependent oxidoreductase [Phycisphaerales bacterium]